MCAGRQIGLSCALMIVLVSPAVATVFALNYPTLPQAFVDTTMPDTAGYVRKTVCASGCDFVSINTALNDTSVMNATTGVVVEVTAGQTFTEDVSLSVHRNAPKWVIVRSSMYGSLPGGTRVTPTDAPKMPKLRGSHASAPGAAYYRFIGIEFEAVGPGTGCCGASNALILWGDATFVTGVIDHVIIDRCYVHATATVEKGIGLYLNGTHIALIDSNVTDFRLLGYESKALLIVHGAGPYKIVNNELEGAGMPVLIGGAYPVLDANNNSVLNGRLLIRPTDLTIQDNYLHPNRAWANRGYGLKNIFEIKHGERFLIEHNVFEYSVVDGQSGQAIVFKSASDGLDSCPSCWSADVTFRYNRVTDVCGTFTFVSANTADFPPPRYHIHDNLITEKGGNTLNNCAGVRADFQLSGQLGTRDLIADHNTFANPRSAAGSFLYIDCSDTSLGPSSGQPDRITVTNNISVSNAPTVAFSPPGGLLGTGLAAILGCLASGSASIAMTNNAVGGIDTPWPVPPSGGCVSWIGTNSSCPMGVDSQDPQIPNLYVNAPLDYSLKRCAPVSFAPGTECYVGAGTDGRDLGADMTLLTASPTPAAPPSLRMSQLSPLGFGVLPQSIIASGPPLAPRRGATSARGHQALRASVPTPAPPARRSAGGVTSNRAPAAPQQPYRLRGSFGSSGMVAPGLSCTPRRAACHVTRPDQ